MVGPPATKATGTASGGQWQVEFARFFPFPDLTATSQFLLPIPSKRRSRPPRGTWMSSSASNATLRVSGTGLDAILTVHLRDHILEEHYVSKLNFAWPQMSCCPDIPVRGSRTVFVTYKDSASEIQKFALRFPVKLEVEAFVFILKESLRSPGIINPQDLRPEISSQSELVSSNRPTSRECDEYFDNSNPIDSYTPEMPPSLNFSVKPLLCFQEDKHHSNSEGVLTTLPPSFTSLLSGCFSDSQIDQASGPGEDLNSQIMKYLGDSSFQDMLLKVERIVNEMGDDWTL